MITTAILAVSINGVIGCNGNLPWKLPKEMKFFKKTTTGSTIIMGRKTFESVGLLKNRETIVISNSLRETIDSKFKVFNSIESALEYCRSLNKSEVFIIGGAEIFKNSLVYCNKIHMSIIYDFFEGDVRFNYKDAINGFKLTEEYFYKADLENRSNFAIKTFERIPN
jgi:dihydrofolate reductase